MEHLEKLSPKLHIEDTRDRFMDYCGNALNGLLGSYDNLTDPDFSGDKEKSSEQVKELWKEFFRRVETFIDTRYETSGHITDANLEKLLEHKNKDPLQPGVIDAVDNHYRSLI